MSVASYIKTLCRQHSNWYANPFVIACKVLEIANTLQQSIEWPALQTVFLSLALTTHHFCVLAPTFTMQTVTLQPHLCWLLVTRVTRSPRSWLLQTTSLFQTRVMRMWAPMLLSVSVQLCTLQLSPLLPPLLLLLLLQFLLLHLQDHQQQSS